MSVREIECDGRGSKCGSRESTGKVGNFVYRFDREAQRLEKAVEQAEGVWILNLGCHRYLRRTPVICFMSIVWMLGGMQNQQFYFMGWRKKHSTSLIYTMFPTNFDRYIEVFGGGVGYCLENHQMTGVWRFIMTITQIQQTLFYCVKNRTGAFLKELRFLPLNSRDEFTVIRKFIEKQEPDTRFLIEELELAEKYLLPPVMRK